MRLHSDDVDDETVDDLENTGVLHVDRAVADAGIVVTPMEAWIESRS